MAPLQLTAVGSSWVTAKIFTETNRDSLHDCVPGFLIASLCAGHPAPRGQVDSTEPYLI